MTIRLKSDNRIPLSRVFLLGLAAGFLSLAPAILPWGGRFVTRGDFIEQQLPFLLEARRILHGGLNAYSFSTFLGAPALGSYAFYTLGSPFVWPLALLSPAAIPYGISVMAVLKHACALLFAFLWLRRVLRRDDHALLCAFLYAFSSFSVVNTQFYHFWEVIAFFPLILLGFEDAMGSRPHPGLLGLCCALNAVTNYYFMFSSALLAALYFLFRLSSPDWAGARSPRRCLLVVAECAAGCALSGVLLVPALRFMMQITRTGARDTSLLLAHYAPATLLERLRALLMPIESGVVHAWYGDAPSWSSCAACLPVFGLTGTAVFLSSPGRERWLRRLLALLALCSCVPVLCGAFALWSNLDYTRWWYGLSALQALATGFALSRTEEGPAASGAPVSSRRWLFAFGVCTLLSAALVLPGLLPRGPLAAAAVGDSPAARLAAAVLNRRTRAWSADAFRVLSLALSMAGGAAMLFILLRRPQRRTVLALTVLVACCQYAAYIAAGDRLIPSGGSEPGTGPYALSEIAGPTLSALKLPETEEYARIDYGTKLRNYGLLRGQSSLTCFQSLRSSTVGRFITAAGYGYDESTTITPPDGSGALRAFLSVSTYHQTDPGDAVPEGFVYDREENGFPVFHNPNAVPMGFLMQAAAPDFAVRLSREALGETLLNCAVLGEDGMKLAAGRLPEAEPSAFLPWQEAAARLRENACDRFRTRADGFDAHIDAKAPGLVVFTIPYDKGFSAVVDGTPADVVPCDLSFMAVYVGEGSHEITFTYRTRGLGAGIALSLLAAAALLLRVLLSQKSTENKRTAKGASV